MPFQTYEELLAWNPPPVKQFISDYLLLEGSRLCFFGGPKLGKSVAAQQLCFCLATGQSWLGFKTQMAKVLYLQCELSKGLFRDRLRQMGRNFHPPTGSCLFETNLAFKLDRSSDFGRLRRDIEKERPNILIIDPWYKVLSMEDNAAYDRTKDNMDMLIQDYNISIVVIHHDTVPKLDATTGQPMTWFHPRGSRTVEGWFDTIIEISGDTQDDVRQLRFELRHGLSLLAPVNLRLNRTKFLMERTI